MPPVNRIANPDISETHVKTSFGALTLGALGVVYGDIGTSPLYALKEVFSPSTGVTVNPENVIGAVSVMIWALMLVVTLKYVMLILRADNRGEGGILALTALACSAVQSQPKLRRALLLLGVFGATLFYGDSVITPAVSVLGALEGLEVVTPAFKPYVIPATLAIMVGLFAIQKHGTSIIGKAFGPVLIVWFVTIATAGVFHIINQPIILAALNPLHGFHFLQERGWYLFATIGAIALVITGAEALYADMGHFGKRPIQLAWTSFVLPALALNYMGQGALLISDSSALENPFYKMYPESMLLFIVGLSACATVIASQAVISGAFSITKQAMQLGLLPRMKVEYTSSREIGQIYIPMVNWVLFVGVVLAVISFGSSSALAGAYGIAVTLTMIITTTLTYFVVRHAWHLPSPIAIGATLLFFCIDALFVAGCSSKIFDGGLFPILLGLMLFLLMETWEKGRSLVAKALRNDGLDLQEFVQQIDKENIARAKRTAIYAVGNIDTVPQALLHNLRHNEVLHQRNIILTVIFKEVPYVKESDRIEIERLSNTFWRVRLNFGFLNTPDVPKNLAHVAIEGTQLTPFEITYFLSRQTVIPTHDGAMSWWRENLFATMHKNAGSVAEYFRLPDNAVVELGTHVQI